MQLTGHEDKLPGQLSGGQQQRVAIARAIVIEPPLLLMDEPLSNLDAKLRLEMRAEIRRIHRELGRTTIYVTHDQDEALSLADRIVVMNDGVVQQVGTPEELYAQPANLHVARFMGYRNVLALDVDGARTATASRSEGQAWRSTASRKQPLAGAHAHASRSGRRILSVGSRAERDRRQGRERRISRPRFADRRARRPDVLLHARTGERVQGRRRGAAHGRAASACWSIRAETRMSAHGRDRAMRRRSDGVHCWSAPAVAVPRCCSSSIRSSTASCCRSSPTRATGWRTTASSSPTRTCGARIITTFQLALPVTILNVGARGADRVPAAAQDALPALGDDASWSIPITLGTVLIAEGMLTYLGPQGWLSQFLQLLHIYDGPIRLTHNYCGVVISLVISGFPFTFLLMLSYVTGIDPALERAAATLGAGPWAQFRHIYLPLLAPGLAITFCLSFVQAFSVFPSAVLLGAPAGPTRVISIAAYQAAFEQYDYSMASAIAMIMGFAQLIVVVDRCSGCAARFYRGPAAGAKDERIGPQPLALSRLERAAARPDGVLRRQHRADDRGGRDQLVRARAGSAPGCRTATRRTGMSRPGRNSSSATCCWSPSRSCSPSCCCRSLIGVPAAYALARREFPRQAAGDAAVPAAADDPADHLRHPAGDRAVSGASRRHAAAA